MGLTLEGKVVDKKRVVVKARQPKYDGGRRGW